jgi:hypothetical protein
MPGFIPPQPFSFFMDESGISNHRFTVVGAICLRTEVIPQVHASIQRFREEHRMYGELKWAKVTDQKSREYNALVDYFFAMNNLNLLQFHCIIFDNHGANHGRYNEGDQDIGLSKLYYQLIVHRFGRNCGPYGDLCVCVDRRNSSTSLLDLLRMANAGIARDCGLPHGPLKQLLPLDSKEDDLLQLNDVILGAVCAARNGKHLLAAGRQSKRDLATLVLQKSGLTTFEQDSPRNVHRFTVWNMRLRPR